MPRLDVRCELTLNRIPDAKPPLPLEEEPTPDRHGSIGRVIAEILDHKLLERVASGSVEELGQLKEAIGILDFMQRLCSRLPHLQYVVQELISVLTAYQFAAKKGERSQSLVPSALAVATKIRTQFLPAPIPPT